MTRQEFLETLSLTHPNHQTFFENQEFIDHIKREEDEDEDEGEMLPGSGFYTYKGMELKEVSSHRLREETDVIEHVFSVNNSETELYAFIRYYDSWGEVDQPEWEYDSIYPVVKKEVVIQEYVKISF